VKLLVWLVLGGVALGVVFFGAIFVASETGGEIVTLTTFEADGSPAETRLWVVDDAGATWLRCGVPTSGWCGRLRANPGVRVRRGGEEGSFTAVLVSEPTTRDRIHVLMADKYGWADGVIGLIRDGEASVAVRLDLAGEPG
jgi:hypothetical protein